MRKMIIGLAAGALVLGASVVPASASSLGNNNTNKEDSIWEIVRDNPANTVYDLFDTSTEILEDIILIAGYSTMLDACGNGKPQYTLFAPYDSLLIEEDGPANLGYPWGVGQLPALDDVLDDFGLDTQKEKDDYYVVADNAYYIPVLEYVLDLLGYSVSDLNAVPSVVAGVLNDHLVNGSFSPWQLDQAEITTMTARSGFTLRNEGGDTVNDQAVLYSEQACNGFVYFIAGFIDSTPQVATEGLNALDTPKDGTPGGSNSLPDTL